MDTGWPLRARRFAVQLRVRFGGGMVKPVSSWHVGIAAEAFAAGQFARLGFDVSVQYGANQPEYDLLVTDGARMLKVSVKGSQDGGWGLTQSHLKNADYQAAIDGWLKRHGARTAMCFVQFKDRRPSELPSMWLATPSEVADRLRSTAKGRGDTILYVHKVWGTRAHGSGSVEQIPASWVLTRERVIQLLAEA